MSTLPHSSTSILAAAAMLAAESPVVGNAVEVEEPRLQPARESSSRLRKRPKKRRPSKLARSIARRC